MRIDQIQYTHPANHQRITSAPMNTEATHPRPHTPAGTPSPAALTDLRITWQAGTLRETRRGKIKAVITGIPGPAFFHAYTHRPQFKATVRAFGITLHRIAKNQWEAIAWINRHTLPIFATLEGITIPPAPVPDKETVPF